MSDRLGTQICLVFLSLYSQVKVYLNLGYFEENLINLMEKKHNLPQSLMCSCLCICMYL